MPLACWAVRLMWTYGLTIINTCFPPHMGDIAYICKRAVHQETSFCVIIISSTQGVLLV